MNQRGMNRVDARAAARTQAQAAARGLVELCEDFLGSPMGLKDVALLRRRVAERADRIARAQLDLEILADVEDPLPLVRSLAAVVAHAHDGLGICPTCYGVHGVLD